MAPILLRITLSARRQPRRLARLARATAARPFIGMRLAVHRPLDDVFYSGFVCALCSVARRVRVKYDDNSEEELLDLSDEVWYRLA